MVKKNSLGRGLDSIFSDNSIDTPAGGISTLRISDVEPKSDQPRQDFNTEALQALAESILKNGVLQPILVRDTGTGLYQIIAGERRWRASKMAGLTEIPAIIMEADELKTAEIALIENIQRENLNPVEEAEAYKTLMETFGLTQEEVSEKVGKSRSAVANSLRLIDLPESVSKYLREGVLSSGHCRALLGLKNKDMIAPLADRVVLKNLSVRETEKAVKDANKTKKSVEEVVETPPQVDYVAELERKVTSTCGRYCKIVTKGKRKTVTVEYVGDGDLEALLNAICGKNIIED